MALSTTYTKVETDYKLQELQKFIASGLKGTLKTTDAAPTTQGLYILSDVGTYTNLGGLVTTAGKLNYAYFDGTTWKLIAVEFQNFFEGESVSQGFTSTGNPSPYTNVEVYAFSLPAHQITTSTFIESVVMPLTGGATSIIFALLELSGGIVTEVKNFTFDAVDGINTFNFNFEPIEAGQILAIKNGVGSFYTITEVGQTNYLYFHSTGTLGAQASDNAYSYQINTTNIPYEINKSKLIKDDIFADKDTVKNLTNKFIPNVSRNLFNKTEATHGAYINSNNGEPETNGLWFYSNFIEVESGEHYIGLGYYAFYNKNRTYISGGLDTGAGVTAVTGSKYVRISFPIEAIETVQLEKGTVATSYQPFYGIMESSIIKDESIVTTETIVVRAGGTVGVDCDFTDIKSALDSITDNSETKRYLVRVKNGTYDISGASYPYLGFKNYVDIVGQNRTLVKVINRRLAVDSNVACFDTAYYGDAIQYASLRNMTCISKNAKSPVHIDSGYNDLASGGTVEVIDCDLINETEEGTLHYQNGLACGLRDGQRVVARNVNSNGQLWVHTSAPLNPNTGCTFELYNCRFPHTMIADVYTYGKDVFIMQNCKTHYVDFNISNPLGHKREYTEYSFTANMLGNEIDYIMGTSDLHGASRYGTWDEAFGGKWGISDSTIHNYCKNNTGTAINRGDLVEIDTNVHEISVKKLNSGKLYGQALDNIAAGGYGIVQYRGVIFIPYTDAVNVGGYVALDALNKAINGTSANAVGVSLGVVDTEIKVRLN